MAGGNPFDNFPPFRDAYPVPEKCVSLDSVLKMKITLGGLKKLKRMLVHFHFILKMP
jgi:hypothetical protein